MLRRLRFSSEMTLPKGSRVIRVEDGMVFVDYTESTEVEIFTLKEVHVGDQVPPGEFLGWHSGAMIFNVSWRCGTVVLFNGDAMVSRIIQFGTGSKWSHAGMVIEYEGKLQLFESTTLSNDGRSGVALRDLSTIDKDECLIRPYFGRVDFNKSDMFVERHLGKPYEQNLFDVVGSAMPWHVDFDPTSFFCSELVAAWFEDQGLLECNPSEITPADWEDLVVVELNNASK